MANRRKMDAGAAVTVLLDIVSNVDVALSIVD